MRQREIANKRQRDRERERERKTIETHRHRQFFGSWPNRELDAEDGYGWISQKNLLLRTRAQVTAAIARKAAGMLRVCLPCRG